MKTHYRSKTNIEINPIKYGKDNLSLINEVIKWKRHHKKDLDKNDLFYAVFDRDPESNTFPHIEQTYRLAKEYGIVPIMSNIAFEVRPILHFEQFQTKINRVGDYENILSKYLGRKYEKPYHNLFNEIKDHIETAVDNAEWLENRHKSGIENGFLREPYTEMHILIKAIIEE